MTSTVQLLGEVRGLDSARLVEPFVVLGHGYSSGAEPLILGVDIVVRSHAVLYGGSALGDRVHVGHGALIREGNSIGNDVSIGSQTQIEPGNMIGDGTRIQSGCFLSNSRLGTNVFVGPNVVFTDDPHPPCPSYLSCVKGAVVGDDVVIGANVTLLPGVQVGAGSLIGAGSVVTEDVPEGMVVAGVPARHISKRADLRCFAGLYTKAYGGVPILPAAPS